MAELDCSTFHQFAVDLSYEIRENGWGEWRLDPGGGTGISGIAAAFYALLVPELWVMIPFNAIVHATSGLLIVLIVYQIFEKMKIAVVAGIPFVVLPSAALWYSQIHKDGLTFLGWFLIFYALASVCTSAVRNSSWKISLRIILCLTLGYVAITSSRGYHSELFKGFTVFAMMILSALLVIEFFRSRKEVPSLIIKAFTYVVTSCLLIFVITGWFAFLTYDNSGLDKYLSKSKVASNVQKFDEVSDNGSISSETSPSTAQKSSAAPPSTAQKSSAASPSTAQKSSAASPSATGSRHVTFRQKLTDAIHNSVEKLHYHRLAFAGYARGTTARSNIDLDFQLSNQYELMRYIPRAYQILFFAPFPNTWANQASNPSTTLMRRAAVLEMIVAYIGLLGIPLVLYEFFRKKALWLILTANLVIMLPLAVIVPNVGLIFRMRYGYLMLIVGIGYSMFYRLLLNRKPTEGTA